MTYANRAKTTGVMLKVRPVAQLQYRKGAEKTGYGEENQTKKKKKNKNNTVLILTLAKNSSPLL